MTEYCATQAVTKFYRSPGLCTYEELTTAEAFLLEYRKLNRLYIEASGDGPHTEAIDCALDKLAWYRIRLQMQMGA